MMQLKDRERDECHHGIIGSAAASASARKLEQHKLLRRRSVLLFIALALALPMGYMNDLLVDRARLLYPQEYPLSRMLSTEEENADDTGDDGPTFVFVMGLEGTGHHLIGALLGQSPNMAKAREIGVCTSPGNKSGELYQLSAQFFTAGNERFSGLLDPKSGMTRWMNADRFYYQVISMLKSIRRKFNKQKDQGERYDDDKPLHIAINANSCHAPSQMSYPTAARPYRELQNFNLDVFYNACTDANVKCKHVYIYRNPWDILKSTTMNRKFNHNIYDGIRLYTSVLQQVHSQLASFPGKNMGCFGFLDTEGHSLQEDWERFGRLWGWDSFDDFKATTEGINMKSLTPMSEEMKASLVPDRLRVLMRALEDIHFRVKDYCYSTLNPIEDQTLSMVEPDEIVLEEGATEAVAPNAVA